MLLLVRTCQSSHDSHVIFLTKVWLLLLIFDQTIADTVEHPNNGQVMGPLFSLSFVERLEVKSALEL